MGRRLSAATIVMAVVGAMFALLLATVPAAAHHKDGHLQGGGKGSAASQDDPDDTDAPSNVPDDGDNAHPSGKDRSVENGGSANQGNSESDPDDDGRGPDRSNGGPDKPNGSGGVDLADQDGNNGCGNDDDFEDDNEGWCGSKPKPAKPPVQSANAAAPCDADATMPGTQPCEGDEAGVLPATPCVDDTEMAAGDEELCGDEDVAGLISRPSTPELDASRAVEEPEVLGERLTQDQPVEGGPAERAASFLGQPLPFTGSGVQAVAAIAVGLLLMGAGLLTTRGRA